VPALLDEDQALASPDVVVLRSLSESVEAARQAAAMVSRGELKAIVILGIPFTPDVLAPAGESRRVGELVRLGVPRSAIVELYRGEDLYEELDALRTTAAERGWRRGVLQR
jgi:hypothetical protein